MFALGLVSRLSQQSGYLVWACDQKLILGLLCSQKINMWSLGCILAELSTGYVLFQVIIKCQSD
jgi:serine/threonine protein kinase